MCRSYPKVGVEAVFIFWGYRRGVDRLGDLGHFSFLIVSIRLATGAADESAARDQLTQIMPNHPETLSGTW